MIEFTFEVNGQGLRRTDRVNPAGDVVGQLWAVFEFDDWWEDTFPIARFMKSGVIYDVEIIDDRCLVPYQALSGEGKFYVTVYAVVPSGRKTTNKEVVEYTTSGLNLSIPPAPQEGTLWEKLYKSLYGGQTGQYLQKQSDDNYDFDFVDLPEGGSGDTPKIQKYTIDADEYRNKTGEQFLEYSPRQISEGVFDVTVAVRVKLVDDVFDNPTPVFANQPISYEGDMLSPFVCPDLKEIMLCFEAEVENEDTGEMELIELRMNASAFVRIFDDDLNAKIEFEFNEEFNDGILNRFLSATISAHYQGLDNDMGVEIIDIVDIHNEALKKATLYYVPYEMGDETIAEVSI